MECQKTLPMGREAWHPRMRSCSSLQVAPESGTPDERLSVSFARREPVKGSDYVANCRALEREHGNGLSFTLRSALRTATRAKVGRCLHGALQPNPRAQ